MKETAEIVYAAVFSVVPWKYPRDEHTDTVEGLPFGFRFPLRRLQVGAFSPEMKGP